MEDKLRKYQYKLCNAIDLLELGVVVNEMSKEFLNDSNGFNTKLREIKAIKDLAKNTLEAILIIKDNLFKADKGRIDE